jgi:hypothetical protein
MHLRRWGWFLALLDNQQRPLFLPDANRPWNAAGILEEVASQQVVGSIQGLPVVTDPNIETNLGASGTEDPVFVLRASDVVLWESGIRARGPAGDQGAEPHGALAAVRLRRVLCSPLPAEHRRDHRPDSTDVLRRLLPHGNKKSGRPAARCGDKPVHRTR